MTAQRLSHPRRIRPIGFLAAAVVIVVAGHVATLVRPPEGATSGMAAAGAGAVQAPAAPGGVPAGPGRPPAIDGPISPAGAPFADTPASLAQIDGSIARWTENLAANEADFISARNLALLYEGRARISGDVGDYGRAAEAADRSLRIEPRQLDVQALHARILLATHDFSGALREAEAVDRAVPDQPAVLAILADARLELGDVAGAAELYGRIQALAPGAAVTARLARVAFLEGDPARALALAERAHGEAAAASEAGPSLSWYGYLAGTLAISAGQPEIATTWFDRALEAWPGSYLALAGAARADAALGDTDAAIEGYRAAIAVAPQPDALTALGDLLALRGDVAAAEEQHATVLAIAQLGAEDDLVYNRQLALFLVDHGGDVAQALALAERELAERKDAYGYDAYAWALLANGRAQEADAASTTALATGIRDARLLFHAGEIALALGDDARARELLEASLGIRGALDPLSAARASESLASIGVR